MDILSDLTLVSEPEAWKNEDGCQVITSKWTSSYKWTDTTKNPPTIIMHYLVEDDGAVTIDMELDFTTSKLKRLIKVGTTLTMDQGMESVSWYGNGDEESYSDRQSYTRVGRYESSVNDMYYPFAKPQDCGNLTGVKWICISNQDSSQGVLICGYEDVNASALHFTAGQLNAAKHVYELTPQKETYVTVDGAVAGTGNASCGYETLQQYQIPNQVYNYSYTILPVTSGTDPMEVSKKYRKQSPVDPPTTNPPAENPPTVTKSPNPAPTDAPSTGGKQKTEPTKVKKVIGIKIKAQKKALKLSWKPQKNVKYYIAYSKSKKKLAKLKNGKVKAVSGTKVVASAKAKKTIGKLKKSKKYYLKVCAVSKDKKTIGKWSKVISKKTK